jgi:hypothetical protein
LNKQSNESAQPQHKHRENFVVFHRRPGRLDAHIENGYDRITSFSNTRQNSEIAFTRQIQCVNNLAAGLCIAAGFKPKQSSSLSILHCRREDCSKFLQ